MTNVQGGACDVELGFLIMDGGLSSLSSYKNVGIVFYSAIRISGRQKDVVD